MNYLILDTNIYYYMCLKSVDSVTKSCFETIRSLLESGLITLLLPEIIKSEFKNGIYNEIDKSKEALKIIIDELDRIVLPLEIIDGGYSWEAIDIKRRQIKKELVKIKNNYNKLDVEKQIEPIFGIMEHKNTILISMDAEIIGQAHIRNLIKKAPSHNKDSEKDCIIIETLLDYLPEHHNSDYDTIYFVSYNTSDFSDPRDKKKIHPDIDADFKYKDINILYNPYLMQLLKDNFGQNIDKAAIKHEKKLSTVSFSWSVASGSMDPAHYSSSACLTNAMALSKE